MELTRPPIDSPSGSLTTTETRYTYLTGKYNSVVTCSGAEQLDFTGSSGVSALRPTAIMVGGTQLGTASFAGNNRGSQGEIDLSLLTDGVVYEFGINKVVTQTGICYVLGRSNIQD
tara:strand:- start:995 stop:1342 length:348 start_codon:yes stop_codon:yes gene_type:complete